MNPNYEMVIGLEVHAQVKCSSKLFSATSVDFGAAPNTHVNPIDLGMPGVLPVLNKAAVDAGIKLGLAIGARVNRISVFARKNYFYPDLPKGYQISQFELPIVEHGHLDIDLAEGDAKRIGITRMHLEEDAGKSVHDLGSDDQSHVDLNRAGVPLMEIVSEPDLRTSEEAGAYLRKLRAVLQFIDVSSADMEKGQMRCDANVSVRRKGDEKLGTRCEIKNLNSVRNVMRAIEHEAERQIDVIENGGAIDQETRLYDAQQNETRVLRSKEDAMDYRYFPDPDLLPLKLTEERIEALKEEMPELPDDIKARFVEKYSLSAYDAGVLTMTRMAADFFEKTLNLNTDGMPQNDPKLCANWMMVELFGALNKAGRELGESPVSPEQLGQLVAMITEDVISGKIAKQVFADMLETGQDPDKIVEEKGLQQVTDTGEIEKIIHQILAENADNVTKYKEGKHQVFGFFVGQVMKATQGKANPSMVNELLKKALD